MAKKQLFIYHGGCFDGFTSAWVFNRFRDPRLDGDVEYVGANYGEEPPDTKGKEVWIADFSYNRETMIEKVIKPSTRTFVFDHHKTAEAALDGILDEIYTKHRLQRQDEVFFDMTRCGSGILYDVLDQRAGKKAGFHKPRYNGQRELWLVDYIEDRDLWKWALPDTKEVSAYVAAQPMTFESWDAINALGKDEVARRGKGILQYIATYGELARKQARMEWVGGHRVPTINVPYMNTSDHVGGLVEENPDAAFAAGYFRTLKGQWQFSLRSKGEFDVSEIAKLFGGGGHKNAAGFQVDTLPWTDPQGLPVGREALATDRS